MYRFLKKYLLIPSNEPFGYLIIPFFFLLTKNYSAFIDNKDMSLDLTLIILKDNFVKLLILTIDILFIFLIFINIEYRIKRKLSFSIEAFKKRKKLIKNDTVKISDELLFIKLLKEDNFCKKIRFKMDHNYHFIFDNTLVDIVSESVYKKNEYNRIPLIIIDSEEITSEIINNLFIEDNTIVALLLRIPYLNNNLNFSITICNYENFSFREIKSFYNI